jgi:aldehyde dehydrogenase (NAD+)
LEDQLMARLDGKVAVITGGSSGIGLATAQRFVDKGAYVFIMGRRHSELDKAKAQEDGVFGPLLPVLTYSSLDEAFQRMSETPRPLAGFVFSRNQSTINRFIDQLSYGGGAVNQVNIQLFVGTMPFGGSGASGIGHYYGKYGFDMLSHAKSMLVSPPDVAIEHLFPPYTADKVEALEQWFQY